MARVLYGEAVLSSIAKELYQLNDLMQEKLFIYYRHLDAKDIDSAWQVYFEFKALEEQAQACSQTLKEQHSAWQQWRAEHQQKQQRRRI